MVGVGERKDCRASVHDSPRVTGSAAWLCYHVVVCKKSQKMTLVKKMEKYTRTILGLGEIFQIL